MSDDLWQLSGGDLAKTPFSTLGLCLPRITKQNQGPDTASFEATGALLDSTLLAPWGTVCTIWKGGQAWFTGRLTKPVSHGDGKGEALQYELSGPWWDLEQCLYQQLASFYNGDPDAPDSTRGLTPLITLGYECADASSPFARITTGAQIRNILTYAISCGANLQVGAIDAGIEFPISQEKGQTASRLIQTVMRWVPDQVLSFDYSTTPPTANVVKRTAAAAVTYSIVGPPALSLNLQPRYDLKVPVVGLFYTYGSNAGGTTWNSQTSDVYPPDQSVRQLGAMIAPLQLGGGSVITEKQPITTATISKPEVDGSGNETVVRWFMNHVPSLKRLNSEMLVMVKDSWFVQMDGTDSSGATATDQFDVNENKLTDFEAFDLSATPRELMIGSITPWMAKPAAPGDDEGTTTPTDGYTHAVKYTVSCQIKYIGTAETDDEYDYSAWINNVTDGTRFDVTITATDALTKVYQKPVSETNAELPPTGLAQYLYESLAMLHWEGEFPIVEQECGGALRVGGALNLTDGRPEWATMKAQIQRVTEDIEQGTTTATVGPPSHLSSSDLLELLRCCRTVNTQSSGLDPRSTGKNDSTSTSGIGAAPEGDSSVKPPTLPKFPWAPSDASDGSGTKCEIGPGTILKSRKIDDMLAVSGLDTARTIAVGDNIWVDVSITNNGDGTTSIGSAEVQSGTPDWGSDPVEVDSSDPANPVQTDFNLLLAQAVAVSDPRDGVVCGKGDAAVKIVPLNRDNWIMRLDADPDGDGAGLACWVGQPYHGAVQ